MPNLSAGAIIRATVRAQQYQAKASWRSALATCGGNPIAAEALIKRRTAEGRLGWCSSRGRPLTAEALFRAGLPQRKVSRGVAGVVSNWSWHPQRQPA